MSPAIRPNRNSPNTTGIVGGILGVREEIANPTPGNPTGPIGQGVCDALASVGYNGIPGNSRTGPGFVCEPYWDGAGIDPPVDSVPFNGGQCAGTIYRGEWTYSTTIAGAATRTADLEGPITSFTARFVRAIDADRDEWEFVLESASNGDRNTTNSFIESGTAITPTTLTAISGPDDCGDPPTDSQPGPSNPGTPPGTPRPLPGFPGVNIEIGDPVVVEGDDFYIPVTITNDDGDEVGPPIFWTPDGLPPELPPPPRPPIQTGDPVEPSEPSGEIEEEEGEDDDPSYETIGYLWNFPSIPANRGGIPGTNPQRYYTVFASCQLKLSDENGLTFWSDETKIKTAQGSIVRPSDALKVIGVSHHRSTAYGPVRYTPIKARRPDGGQ